MGNNKDRQVKIDVPFLQDGTVMYVDSRIGTSHFYIEDVWEDLLERFRDIGYKFLFLPDLYDCLAPSLMNYMFPGREGYLFVENMYQHVQDLAGLDDKTGFLYKLDGKIFFRVIPESSEESIEAEIDDLIGFLRQARGFKKDAIRFRKAWPGTPVWDFSEGKCYSEPGPPPLEDIHPDLFEDDDVSICHECTLPFEEETAEEPDQRIQKIIKAWEKIEKEFGITIEDLDIILGYRVKLSRLNITTSGKIILSDWHGGEEVKMDDLTKALYFFYLRHPEGVALKELQTYDKEILDNYMAITGRDDMGVIRSSIDRLLDPYGNNLNVSISRIKKAFRDVVGDRIAKFYYVDGHYAGPRKVALDRDLVIWDH